MRLFRVVCGRKTMAGHARRIFFRNRRKGLAGLMAGPALIPDRLFPVVPSGNCHSGILMIAEKCADMIKRDSGLS